MPRSRKKLDAEEQNWRRLQESLANRTSHYFQGVGELIQRRSLEPKEWLGGYADFWKDVIGDVGDWMLLRDEQKLRPTPEWVKRFSLTIPRMQQTAAIPIVVPEEAFGIEKEKEITLVTDGLSRGNRRIVIRPDGEIPGNVSIDPQKVQRLHRRDVSVRFSRLTDLNLQAGIYSGIVCADETDVTVAVIELTVH